MGWRDGSTRLTALPGRRPQKQEPAQGPWMPDPVFWDDAIPPSQARSPEHRLMMAVLEDAILVLRRPVRPIRLDVSRTNDLIFSVRDHVIARQEALAWVASGDTTWPFSFENICQRLGFDPGWLRARIATLTPGPGSRRGRPSMRSQGTDALTPGIARTRAEAAQRREAPGLGRGAG